MDTPGLGVDDIKVEIEDTNILTISGEGNCEVEDDESDYYERIYGKFSRSFKLLDNSDTDNLRSTINRGVLSVTIPKHDPDPPSIRQIQIENTDEDTSDH
jgi:HSP20 family protein